MILPSLPILHEHAPYVHDNIEYMTIQYIISESLCSPTYICMLKKQNLNIKMKYRLENNHPWKRLYHCALVNILNRMFMYLPSRVQHLIRWHIPCFTTSPECDVTTSCLLSRVVMTFRKPQRASDNSISCKHYTHMYYTRKVEWVNQNKCTRLWQTTYM